MLYRVWILFITNVKPLIKAYSLKVFRIISLKLYKCYIVYKSFTGLTIICKQIIVVRSPEQLYLKIQLLRQTYFCLQVNKVRARFASFHSFRSRWRVRGIVLQVAMTWNISLYKVINIVWCLFTFNIKPLIKSYSLYVILSET